MALKIGTSIRFTLKNHGRISTKDAIVKNILDDGIPGAAILIPDNYSRFPNNTVGNLFFGCFFHFYSELLDY